MIMTPSRAPQGGSRAGALHHPILDGKETWKEGGLAGREEDITMAVLLGIQVNLGPES